MLIITICTCTIDKQIMISKKPKSLIKLKVNLLIAAIKAKMSLS